MPRHRALLVTLVVAVALVATTLAGCVAPGGVASEQRDSKVTELAVTQSSEGGARLTWSEFPVGNAKSFNVYKDGQKVASVTAPKRTWLDTGVTPQVTVTYTAAAVMKDGRETEKALPVSFTLRQSLNLDQDADVSRGFVNFSVAEVSPGLTWSDLELRVAGKVIPRDDLAYENGEEAWTHSDRDDDLVDLGEKLRVAGKIIPRDDLAYENGEEAWTHSDRDDDLVDLGEKLRVYAPGNVKRDRLVEVALADRGVILDDPTLTGRPVLNVTLAQDVRNASAGLVSVTVVGWAWMDGYEDVTSEHPDLVPRWRDLAVSVNGTRLAFRDDGRNDAWWHDNPSDEVIRERGTLNVRSASLVHAGALVTVTDDVSGATSFVLKLR